jgi:hypothetical protein
MNEKLEGEKVTLKLINGEEILGYNVEIKSDSTSIGDIKLSTASIKKITNPRHDRGALKGLGYGALIGAPIGFIVGYISYEDSPSGESGPNSAGASGGIGALLLGGPTALVGLIVGGIHGDIGTFIFPPSEMESKPSPGVEFKPFRVEFTEIVEEGSGYIIILWQGKEIRLSNSEYNFRWTIEEGKQFMEVPQVIYLQKFK